MDIKVSGPEQKIVELFEHQKRAIARSHIFPYQLIIRSPGTGKTLIGINIVLNQIQQDGKSKILWIGPAHLENQYKCSFNKFALKYHSIFSNNAIRYGECNLCSFDMLRLNERMLCNVEWDVVLVDEIHKAKNHLTKTNKALWKLRKKAKHFFAFTGTPFQNHPFEFFELLSLCSGKHITIDCEECLEYQHPRYTPIRNFFRRLGMKLSRVNQGPIIGIKDEVRLKKILCNIVDYIPQKLYLKECQLPEVNVHISKIELEQSETEDYRRILKQYSRKKKFQNFVSNEMEDSKLENVFNNLTKLRSFSISHSKIIAVVNEIRQILSNNSSAKILVFSNFVEKGLYKVSHELNLQKLPHLLYYGNINHKRRDSLVAEYLSSKIQIMLLSPVGFEGLDLYGTTNVIILDPHYNPERTIQLTSRAVRAFSGVSSIDVIQFLSVSSKLKAKSIDESIIAISDRKKRFAEMLQTVLINS